MSVPWSKLAEHWACPDCGEDLEWVRSLVDTHMAPSYGFQCQNIKLKKNPCLFSSFNPFDCAETGPRGILNDN